MKSSLEDLKHYLFLGAILSIGFGAFWYFNYTRMAQVGVTIAMGAAYVLWGIIHHTIKKDLHWRIILEYLVVAGVASMVTIFLLLRA